MPKATTWLSGSFSSLKKLKLPSSVSTASLDKEVVQRNVLRPLIVDAAETSFVPPLQTQRLRLQKPPDRRGHQRGKRYPGDLKQNPFRDTALLIDKEDAALIIASRGFATRSVTEPSSEAVVRGPRESFTESMRTNTSLIRRKINNPDLVFESFTLWKRDQYSCDHCLP